MTKTGQLKSRFVEGFEAYNIERELNAGNFARVYKVRELATGKRFAAKFIEKSRLSAVDHENAVREVELMSRLTDHPNIVKLKESIETSEYYILVMELMRGGDLFDRLHEKEVFTEKETRRVMQQLATAVKHVHEKGIAHRDLKIENVMFVSADSDLLKLGDFGLAKELGKATSNTPVGTLHYMAPEVASRKFHSKSVDIWSLGCICFVLLYGTFPFFEDNSPDKCYQDLREKVILGRFTFPEDGDHRNHPISPAVKDLISRSMMVDATKRLDIDEFLNHPWMTASESDDDDLAPSRHLNSTTSVESVTPVTPESPLLGSTAATHLGTAASPLQPSTAAVKDLTLGQVTQYPGQVVVFCESTSSTLVAKRSLSLTRLSLESSAGDHHHHGDNNKPEKRKKIRELFNTLIKAERSRVVDPAQQEAERMQERIPRRSVKLADLIPSKLMQRRRQRLSGLRNELRQPSSPLGSISS